MVRKPKFLEDRMDELQVRGDVEEDVVNSDCAVNHDVCHHMGVFGLRREVAE
jgi:hypothetical protein